MSYQTATVFFLLYFLYAISAQAPPDYCTTGDITLPRDVLSQQCNGSMSCDGRCGTEGPHCSCDTTCLSIGDCCFDFSEKCHKEASTSGISSELTQVLQRLRRFVRCFRPYGGTQYISAVTQCPGDWYSSTDSARYPINSDEGRRVNARLKVKEECDISEMRIRTVQSLRSLLQVTPVVLRNTSLVFKNKHCAVCHGVKQIYGWRVEVKMDETVKDELSGNLEDLMTRVKSVSISAPTDFPVRSCTRGSTPKSSCAKSCQALQDKCLREPQAIITKSRYRNHYCALCNNMDKSDVLSNEVCSVQQLGPIGPQEGGPTRSPGIFIFGGAAPGLPGFGPGPRQPAAEGDSAFALSLIIRVTGPDSVGIEADENDRGANNLDCPLTSSSCSIISCSPGYNLVNGTCEFEYETEALVLVADYNAGNWPYSTSSFISNVSEAAGKVIERNFDVVGNVSVYVAENSSSAEAVTLRDVHLQDCLHKLDIGSWTLSNNDIFKDIYERIYLRFTVKSNKPPPLKSESATVPRPIPTNVVAEVTEKVRDQLLGSVPDLAPSTFETVVVFQEHMLPGRNLTFENFTDAADFIEKELECESMKSLQCHTIVDALDCPQFAGKSQKPTEEPPEKTGVNLQEIESVLTVILMSLSILFLLVRILLHCCVSEFQTASGRLQLLICVPLCLFYITFLAGGSAFIYTGKGSVELRALATLSVFFRLTTFFASNAVAVHLFSVFRNAFVRVGDGSALFYCRVLVHTLLPALCVVGAGLCVQYISPESQYNPSFGEMTPWIAPYFWPQFIFFFLPAGLVVLINLILYVMVIVRLFVSLREEAELMKRSTNSMRQLKIYAILFVLCGMSWTIAFVAVPVQNQIMNLFFAVVLASEGIFFGIATLANTESVRRLCSGKKEESSSRQPSSNTRQTRTNSAASLPMLNVQTGKLEKVPV